MQRRIEKNRRKLMRNKRSTIAPVCFSESRNYLMIGTKYIKVLSFYKYPTNFIEGFLAPMIMDPHYYIDMVTEHSELNHANALKGEYRDIQEKYDKSSSPTEKEALHQKKEVLKVFIEESVRTGNSTLNVIVQLYVKGDTIEELNEHVKEVKERLGDSTMGIQLSNISFIQESLYRKNSAIFIKHGLRTETDFLNGHPMSSISVAGLWPWIFDTLEDPYGSLLGKEITSQGKVIFDQFFYLNAPEDAKLMDRKNGNMIVVGQSGSGKTTTMLIIIMNHIINHRKIVWIDPENKNKQLCDYVGGNYISLGRDNQIINIFDLKPIDTDDDSINEEAMYDISDAISNVINDIKVTFRILWPNLSENAMSMISEIVVDTYASVGITEGSFRHLTAEQFPTFTNFSAVLKDKIESRSREMDLFGEEVKALKELEMRMRDITGYGNSQGAYGRYFNGTTTIKSSTLDETGMIAIGTKHLFNVEPTVKVALLRMVFQYCWSLCLGHSREETVFVNDEQHMFISNPELANILAVFQRRARKYHTVTLYGTQEVADYNGEFTKDAGNAIFTNATYKFYMTLEKKGVIDLAAITAIDEGEQRKIMNFLPHQGLLVAGNRHISIDVLATKQELQLM